MAACEIQSLDCMVHDEAVDHGNHVGNTIASIENETFVPALGHEGKECLSLEISGSKFKLLEDKFRHLLTILLAVQGSLSHEDFIIFQRCTSVFAEFFRERVIPELFESCPVLDGSLSDGVVDVELMVGLKGLVSEHDIFEEARANLRLSSQFRSAYDGGDAVSGELVSSETCL